MARSSTSGQGRPAGVPNKATASLKEMARAYTGQALATLVNVMNDVNTPAGVRIQAAKEILDRAYGKQAPLTYETTTAEQAEVERDPRLDAIISGIL